MDFTKQQIFENLKEFKDLPKKEAVEKMTELIELKAGRALTEMGKLSIEKKLEYLVRKFQQDMKSTKSSLKTIAEKHKDSWNLPCITVPEHSFVKLDVPQSSQPSKAVGRPSKHFINVCKRTEQDGASKIASSVNNNYKMLLRAVKIAAKHAVEPNKHLAALVDDILNNLDNIRNFNVVRDGRAREPVVMNDEEALGFLIENNLSKQAYQSMRSKCKEKNAQIFPAYNHVRAAKNICRPTVMHYSDTKASTTIESLFEHTAKRLIQSEINTVQAFLSRNTRPDDDMETEQPRAINLTLHFADGGDGTTGFSHYHQKLPSGGVVNDHSLFTWTATPILLEETDTKEVLWKNRVPNSPFANRPILLEFAKESTEYVLRLYEELVKEKEALEDIRVQVEDALLFIKPKFHTTLLDGKVFNIIMGTSSQKCPVCSKTAKDFCDPKKCIPKEDGLLFGCQPLHAIINSFNFLLKLSYRLENMEWAARTQQQKDNVRERKADIQERLRNAFGITFDMPRAGGFGNTTTGNLCRRAFAEPEKLAEALGLDVILVKNLSIILAVLNCKEEIEVDKLQQLCQETLTFFTRGGQYEWNKLTPTVHKILVHSKDIIMMLPLSPGYFSEEGAEAHNKIYKAYRLSNSRKTSVKVNLMDVFNRAMDASDPLIFASSVHTRQKKRKHRPIPNEVLQYLKHQLLEDHSDETFSHTNPTYADNFNTELDDCVFDVNFDSDDENSM
jgi:hypothetical protein